MSNLAAAIEDSLRQMNQQQPDSETLGYAMQAAGRELYRLQEHDKLRTCRVEKPNTPLRRALRRLDLVD